MIAIEVGITQEWVYGDPGPAFDGRVVAQRSIALSKEMVAGGVEEELNSLNLGLSKLRRPNPRPELPGRSAKRPQDAQNRYSAAIGLLDARRGEPGPFAYPRFRRSKPAKPKWPRPWRRGGSSPLPGSETHRLLFASVAALP